MVAKQVQLYLYITFYITSLYHYSDIYAIVDFVFLAPDILAHKDDNAISKTAFPL